MCYYLKTKMMTKILDKRKKDKPFLKEEAENYSLDPTLPYEMINSYYFSSHNEEESLFIRLGDRNPLKEIWFFYKDKDNEYSLKDSIFKENKILKIYKKDEEWNVEFDGLLVDKTDKEVKCSLKAVFKSKSDIIDFSYNMPSRRMAKAIAFGKWSKELFQEQQKLNQTHYEEFGRLLGTLTLDTKEIKLDLPCVRDHSFGKRDWNMMNNHLWLMALNDTKEVNFSMVSYPSMTLLEVGNFIDNDRVLYMKDATYDRNQVIKEDSPKEFTMTILLENKEKLNIKATPISNKQYIFQDGQYILNENIALFDINGEKFKGILEIGYNSDTKRHYNNHKVEELRK